jgi:uncharacterized damage-inducible protein DinB
MNAKDVLRNTIEMSHMVIQMSLGDLDDADLLVRPVAGANHIAWQLGHMIAGTCHMLSELGHPPPEIPAAVRKVADKEAAASDDPAQFATKAEYLRLSRLVQTAALAAVDATPDASLDQPGPASMRDYAPTIASVLSLLGLHWMMHMGQITVVRRKLGKPVIF